VVPKKRPEKGALVDNDVQCTAIYHKMGYRGAPITQLSLGDNDDCRAWLIGEPGQGLRYMFQMMNEARVEVGMSAAATASAAYYSALEYTKERPQGRHISEKDPNKPQIPIIQHSDIKRMLLFQRAIFEGSLSLCLQCAIFVDLTQVLDGEEKEKYELLLDLLTPVAKSYPSEMGQLSVSQGLQCLGGYGYCDEFPLEQYYRDIRIHPIHEGTTGIQAMDLLGRKVTMKKGKAYMLFLEETGKTINDAKSIADLKTEAGALDEALKKLTDITQHLSGLAMKGEVDNFLADATLYLELFGIIAIAWQWLIQAVVAAKALSKDNINTSDRNFFTGKLFTFRFFFNYELPKIEGLLIRLKNSDGLTVKMKTEFFDD
jgi:butyryl-CoA dehydrogenase